MKTLAPAMMQYHPTESASGKHLHAVHVADETSDRERALRRLPLTYSLALRLRDAGICDEVISQYVNVELVGLDGLYRIAEAKLLAAQNAVDD